MGSVGNILPPKPSQGAFWASGGERFGQEIPDPFSSHSCRPFCSPAICPAAPLAPRSLCACHKYQARLCLCPKRILKPPLKLLGAGTATGGALRGLWFGGHGLNIALLPPPATPGGFWGGAERGIALTPQPSMGSVSEALGWGRTPSPNGEKREKWEFLAGMLGRSSVVAPQNLC